MPRFQVTNRITGATFEVEAPRAQDACEKLGWLIDHCGVEQRRTGPWTRGESPPHSLRGDKQGKPIAPTRVLAVVHHDGRAGFCLWHPDRIALEVAEGSYAGKRGCDTCLQRLVGPICWEHSEVVSYETGQRRSALR